MRNPRRKKWVRILIFPFAILLGIAAFLVYNYLNFNLWVGEDAGQLQPYPRVLIENEQPLHLKNPASDRTVRMIEDAIVMANAKDRIVLNLSRSDIRFSLFGNKAYVKVFLRTAIPKDRARATSIKTLNILVKWKDRWRVQTTQDISIE